MPTLAGRPAPYADGAQAGKDGFQAPCQTISFLTVCAPPSHAPASHGEVAMHADRGQQVRAAHAESAVSSRGRFALPPADEALLQSSHLLDNSSGAGLFKLTLRQIILRHQATPDEDFRQTVPVNKYSREFI